MNARNRISSQSDFDPRHFRFTRQSGLRPEDFARSFLDRHSEKLPAILTWASVAALVVALWFGWIVPGDVFQRIR